MLKQGVILILGVLLIVPVNFSFAQFIGGDKKILQDEYKYDEVEFQTPKQLFQELKNKTAESLEKVKILESTSKEKAKIIEGVKSHKIDASALADLLNDFISSGKTSLAVEILIAVDNQTRVDAIEIMLNINKENANDLFVGVAKTNSNVAAEILAGFPAKVAISQEKTSLSVSVEVMDLFRAVLNDPHTAANVFTALKDIDSEVTDDIYQKLTPDERQTLDNALSGNNWWDGMSVDQINGYLNDLVSQGGLEKAATALIELIHADVDLASKVINEIKPAVAATIFTKLLDMNLTDKQIGSIKDVLLKVDSNQIAAILSAVDHIHKMSHPDYEDNPILSSEDAARIVEMLSLSKATEVISILAPQRAAHIINNMGIYKAIQIVNRLDVKKAAVILNYVDIDRIVEMFTTSTLNWDYESRILGFWVDDNKIGVPQMIHIGIPLHRQADLLSAMNTVHSAGVIKALLDKKGEGVKTVANIFKLMAPKDVGKILTARHTSYSLKEGGIPYGGGEPIISREDAAKILNLLGAEKTSEVVSSLGTKANYLINTLLKTDGAKAVAAIFRLMDTKNAAQMLAFSPVIYNKNGITAYLNQDEEISVKDSVKILRAMRKNGDGELVNQILEGLKTLNPKKAKAIIKIIGVKKGVLERIYPTSPKPVDHELPYGMPGYPSPKPVVR